MIDRRALREAGQLAVQLVVERTLAGRDRTGAPFAPYSTRPLAIPAGATGPGTGPTKTALKTLSRQEDGLFYFTSPRTGNLWVLIEGGYAALKRARYPQDSGGVNLSASGAMLRGLGVVRQTADSVTIGFSRAELAERALFNLERRDFLGLTQGDEAEVARLVEAGLSLAM